MFTNILLDHATKHGREFKLIKNPNFEIRISELIFFR